nr:MULTISPECIES: hypothetical protein [environmental samples]
MDYYQCVNFFEAYIRKLEMILPSIYRLEEKLPITIRGSMLYDLSVITLC